jgi:hypothetical protein
MTPRQMNRLQISFKQRIAEDEPEKAAIKANGLFFQEKEKRLSESKYSTLAESHVPCFQERVGTGHPGYMIPDRLPWRLRARPSATLHEIQVRPTNERQSELVPAMIQTERSAVKSEHAAKRVKIKRLKRGVPHARGVPHISPLLRDVGMRDDGWRTFCIRTP